MSVPRLEIDRLRRYMRDLIALSSMPAVWVEQEPRLIGEDLCDILLGILRLDFIHLRIKVRNGDDHMEITRVSESGKRFVIPDAIGEKLISGLTSGGAGLLSVLDPAGAGPDRLAAARVGYQGEFGILVAGSGRSEFPTEEDRLLLNVGANQLAFMLQRTVAEDALRGREQAQRHMIAIVESSDDAIVSKNLDGIIESWNPGAERLYGYTADEIVGKSVATLFPPELRDELPELMDTVKRGNRIREHETVRIRKDGTRINVSVSISPIHDEKRAVIGISVIARDITPREQAERRRMARLAITEVLAQASTIKDAAGRILQAICESLGWDVGDHWIVDREAQVMRWVELWHSPSVRADEFEADSRQRTFEIGAGLPGRVWASRKPAWIRDVMLDAAFPRAPVAAASGLHSALGIPILLGDQVLGVIEFFSRQIREPDPDLLEMMASIGGQIGQFIERTRAEEAARESQARYRAVVESDVAGVLFWHVDGRLLDCNGYAARMLGYSAEEIRSGQVNWKTITPPEHVEIALQKTEEAIRHGKATPWEKEYIRKDGSRVPVLIASAGYSWSLEQGLAVVLDISDLKRAEREVLRLLAYERQQKTRLHRVAEVSLKINSALTMEDVLHIITEEAREIIGAHQSVSSITVGRGWAQAVTAVSLSDKYSAWRAYDAKPDGSGIYATVCESNRPIRLSQRELEAHPRWRGFGAEAGRHPPLNGWLAAPFISSQGENLGLIQLSDRFEGEFTEEDEDLLVQLAHMAAFVIENSNLYEELRNADRAKDEFLALVSHEIRNPLNAIMGWTQLTRSDKADQTLISRALEIIERNARIQAKLIDDIVDVSRILTGKLKVDRKPIEIASVIGASVDAARLAAESKSIDLRYSRDYFNGVVTGDLDRLQQIVLNLLNNAIKFTPEGGRVEVSLERVVEPAGRPCARVTVSDTGVGIDADFLPYVFDRFRQADSSTTKKQGGLGLGLAIVKHLAEIHGGRVEAKSEGKDQGSAFIVTLPLAEVPQSMLAGKSLENPASRIPLTKVQNALEGLSVLIVDDDLDARESLSMGVQNCGAEIEVCSSAAEAMAALQRRVPDVIVCDIAMPDEDGYMFISKVRAMLPHPAATVPAVAVTGYAGEEMRQHLLASGFQAHFPKPTDIRALVRLIAELAEQRSQ